jgi:hypothetical protein
LDDLKEKRRYWKLKRNNWSAIFGELALKEANGSVVRQATE